MSIESDSSGTNGIMIYSSKLPNNIRAIYFYAFKIKCIAINNKIKKEEEIEVINELMDKKRGNPKAELLAI